MGFKIKIITYTITGLIAVLTLVSGIFAFVKIINWVSERNIEHNRYIASMDECERIQYRIDNARLINQKTVALEEQRNLILIGKCGNININTKLYE